MKRPVLARALAIWIAALLTAGLLLPRPGGPANTKPQAGSRAHTQRHAGPEAEQPKASAAKVGQPGGRAETTPLAGGTTSNTTRDGRRISRDPADLGPNFRDRDFEERALSRKPHPQAVEIARGDLPGDRGAWRAFRYPNDQEPGDQCLALNLLAYTRDPSAPFATSIGGGLCSFPRPIYAIHEAAEGAAAVWVGLVDGRASTIQGQVATRTASGQVIPLPGQDRRAFVVVMPDEQGVHQLIARDPLGVEVARYPGRHFD
jgi:hypothetical protein